MRLSGTGIRLKSGSGWAAACSVAAISAGASVIGWAAAVTVPVVTASLGFGKLLVEELIGDLGALAGPVAERHECLGCL